MDVFDLATKRNFEPGAVFGGFPEDPSVLIATDQHPCANLFDIIRDGIVYRTVDGWPMYRVGEDGTVWSRRQSRSKIRTGWHWWRQLKPTIHSAGYPRVYFSHQLEGGPRSVHSLVLEAFVGPRPEGMEACHNDGNPANNRLGNLRWDTPSANSRDKYVHGTQAFGEKTNGAKLVDSDIPIIIELAKSRMSTKRIATRYGLTISTISRILKGKTWTHIPRTAGLTTRGRTIACVTKRSIDG